MNRTPMLPSQPRRPSFGPRRVGPVEVSITVALLFIGRYGTTNMTAADESVKIQKTTMSHQERTYRMRQRADAQDATRLRITESAVELHERLGPARTTMAAV